MEKREQDLIRHIENKYIFRSSYIKLELNVIMTHKRNETVNLGKKGSEMGRSIQAVNVNPAILKWARETSGYNKETISKRINVTESELTSIENGEKNLTVVQLQDLTKAYKRPTAIFYLEEVPETFVLPDFRSMAFKPDVKRSDRSLNIKIRGIYEKRKNAIDLMRKLEINLDYSYIDLFFSTEKEEIMAERIRSLLNVKTEELKKLKNNEVLNYWKEKLEEKKILIFQFQRIELDETRGFVIADTPLPTIAINQKDTYYARVFTLIHEFCHILIHKSGLCNAQVLEGDLNSEEIYCNKVASLVLVPKNELYNKLSEFQEYRIKEKIKELSKYFKVSYSVILFHLKKNNLISNVEFRKTFIWVKDNQRKYYDRDKSDEMDYYVVYFSKTSRYYLTMVFNAFYEGKIDYNKALDYVGQSMNTFETIHEKFVYGG